MTRRTEDRKKRAKKLLVHYFSLIFERADKPLDWECRSEIGDIIDAIFDEMADIAAATVNTTVGTVETGASVVGAKIDFL